MYTLHLPNLDILICAGVKGSIMHIGPVCKYREEKLNNAYGLIFDYLI